MKEADQCPHHTFQAGDSKHMDTFVPGKSFRECESTVKGKGWCVWGGGCVLKMEGRDSLSEEGHTGRGLKEMKRRGDLGGGSSRQRE